MFNKPINLFLLLLLLLQFQSPHGQGEGREGDPLEAGQAENDDSLKVCCGQSTYPIGLKFILSSQL